MELTLNIFFPISAFIAIIIFAVNQYQECSRRCAEKKNNLNLARKILCQEIKDNYNRIGIIQTFCEDYQEFHGKEDFQLKLKQSPLGAVTVAMSCGEDFVMTSLPRLSDDYFKSLSSRLVTLDDDIFDDIANIYSNSISINRHIDILLPLLDKISTSDEFDYARHLTLDLSNLTKEVNCYYSSVYRTITGEEIPTVERRFIESASLTQQ